ncbi:UPF0481 protein At3g47200-like [Cynara cardunculus var. scolymus]|uniref:UPF0481 protein At3g47200-like n=1 Tax=Cynara cardunculus var. scolymus TaxID=59895 RepID=UPI000D625DB9|nr:UPF0481 protein At3g47200-like [Cynara cardunculus var. scolymus]
MENIHVKKGDVETIQMIQFLVAKEKERRNHRKKLSPSIYIVDSTLRNLSPNSFKPRVVAIGPLHKEDEELQDIESHKVTYLLDLFLRLPSMPDRKMDECIQRVYAKVEQIRACYAGEMKDYDDGEVAKMMVIDGCFVLEFILRVCNYPDEDPIFYNKLAFQNVMRDLLLLENQIPFFVLQDIFKCTILEFDPSSSLQSLIFLFLRPINPFDISYVTNINDGVDTSYEHVLGLLQKFCQPADAKPSGVSVSRFHSVEELTNAGVNFKRNQDERWPLAMEFKATWFPCFLWGWGKPTLTMPVLLIADRTESVLRNLIAYEQCSPLSDTLHHMLLPWIC